MTSATSRILPMPPGSTSACFTVCLALGRLAFFGWYFNCPLVLWKLCPLLAPRWVFWISPILFNYSLRYRAHSVPETIFFRNYFVSLIAYSAMTLATLILHRMCLYSNLSQKVSDSHRVSVCIHRFWCSPGSTFALISDESFAFCQLAFA